MLNGSSSNLYTMVVGISDQNISSHHVDCYAARLCELSVAFARVTKLTVVGDLLPMHQRHGWGCLTTARTALDVGDEHVRHREDVRCGFRRRAATAGIPAIGG